MALCRVNLGRGKLGVDVDEDDCKAEQIRSAANRRQRERGLPTMNKSNGEIDGSARVVLDLSRLVFAAWKRAPTGIPRVELAYAEYFIANSSKQLQFVVLDVFGRLRVIDNQLATDFVKEIAQYWRCNIASIAAHLRVVARALQIHALLLLGLRGNLIGTISQSRGPVVYIITSQWHLDRIQMMERIKSAGNLKLVYFIHDILPCVFPEYFPTADEKRTRRAMENAARLADVVVANSQATADAFRKKFDQDRLSNSIVVAPLGLSVEAPRKKKIDEPAKPYFVMVGTIEPRKNHLLILNVWRTLRAELGADAPHLVLIGGRGWENENIVDMLERSPPLQGFVEERSRISDEEMVQIVSGARALLMPSFAEGYGLPLADALALGVPALCSDIPTLREIGGDVPEFLDPLDGIGWRSTIVDYLDGTSGRRQAQLQRLIEWQPPRWDDHFSQISHVLKTLTS